MICPECGEEITYVNVFRICRQEGTLEGKSIVWFDEVDVYETIREAECPECLTDIKQYLEGV